MIDSNPTSLPLPEGGRLLPRYRSRVLDLLSQALAPEAPFARALDFGSGDGWFAESLRRKGLIADLTAVDVVRRPSPLVEPVVYKGGHLPFDDLSFDLVFAVDAVHHAADPEMALREMLRCSRAYLLLKDHTYSGPLGWLMLAALDELGNRRFGIPSPGHYQRGWEWWPILQQSGFERVRVVHPARCHSGLLGWVSNRSQFVALWRRKVKS